MTGPKRGHGNVWVSRDDSQVARRSTGHKETTPPYSITPRIVSLVAQITKAICDANGAAIQANSRLQKSNRIRAIHGSLAIEGNILSEKQIWALMDGRPVIGPLRDIQEARNAIKVYEKYLQWNPASESDLLNAHEVLTLALLDAPGHYRRGSVAVVGGGEIHHIGPSANRVPQLMSNLLSWLGGTAEHPLIASSVFHYEFEFIHPFADGNGRMGRLWQSLILTRWKTLFAHVPVERYIHARQGEYYLAIRESSAQAESTPFVIFMLEVILEALTATIQVTLQVESLLAVLKGEMSLRQLLLALGLRDRKSFRQRYLWPALNLGYVEMTHPDSPTAPNQRYRITVGGREVRRMRSSQSADLVSQR